MMRDRRKLEESIRTIKEFWGDEYDKEKYSKRMIFGIRLIPNIKKDLKKIVEKNNSKEKIKLKSLIEKIVEDNIDSYVGIEQFGKFENFTPIERYSIELNWYTMEQALNIKNNSNIESINKLINLILLDYLSDEKELVDWSV